MSNPRNPPKKESPKRDYYKNPRSDITSVISHLVHAEKEKYDLEKKNSQHQSTIFKLVSLLDKTSEKRNYYKNNYRQMIHKMDYLLVMSKIMKKSIIKHIRKVSDKYDLTDNCTLCLERLDKTSETVMITTCSHFFHKDCILKSLSSIHNKCPNCRTQILLVELGTNVGDKFVPSKNNKLYTIMNHTFESVDFSYFAGADEEEYPDISNDESEEDEEDEDDFDEDASEVSSIQGEDEDE